MLQYYDYITIALYLAFLLGVGWVFGRMSKSASDYIRGGGTATWWLVGSSAGMATVSAYTFTGAAAAAFEAGPTVLVIYAANVIAYVTHALWFARRFRQSRAYTDADILRIRFGPEVEQFRSYYGLLIGVSLGAVPLWALAVFCATIFKLDSTQIIVVLGVVVTLYAMKGGKWAVMGNDFVQSLIVLPITLVVAYLCWRAVGGWDGFLALFSRPDLAADFELIKPAGSGDGRFDLSWVLVVFAIQYIGQVNLLQSQRFLAARDGREASRAAWFCAAALGVGALVWFIPPMVARALWSPEVLAIPVERGGAAYAVAALKVLPNGLIGVMLVAMFATTLSTMDVALNSNAGIFVRNVMPALRGLFRLPPLSDSAQVFACRIATVVFGVVSILVAVFYSRLKNFGLFDSYLIVGSIIGLPLTIPMIAGLLIKRLPRWSFFAIFAASLAPAVYSLLDESLSDRHWTYTERGALVLLFGVTTTLICIPFYARSSQGFRDRVEAFFERMRTPLSSEEKGVGSDRAQALILGRFSTLMGGLLLLLLLVPNDAEARLSILFIAFSVMALGSLLWRAGAKREVSQVRATDPTDSAA
ncbi:MAG: hypothetical protein IT582_06565 [Opitutaceae bacterium]|nr:hypothetical protein [Opitutaceae bacterium]